MTESMLANPSVLTTCPVARSYPGRTSPFLLRALAAALALTLGQILVAGVLSGQKDLTHAYRALFEWDGYWYGRTAVTGYTAPVHLTPQDPGNAAFFPGYPLLARQVAHMLRIDTVTALLVTAQISCWGFWTYFLLLSRHWGLSRSGTSWAVLLIISQPGSFFLVSSYSEALFLCLLFGFLYWSQRTGGVATALAAVHGFGMTATRLVGIPLAILPLAWDGIAHLRGPNGGFRVALRRSPRALFLMLAAGAGALSFFAYCHLELGRWDMPLKSHEIGWDVHPCYYAIFSYRLFRPLLGYGLYHGLPLLDDFLDPNVLDQLAGAVLWLVMAAVLIAEISLRRCGLTGLRGRAPLYLGAFLVYYLSVCGHLTRHLSSMIRFSVCVLAILVPAVVLLAERWGRPLSIRLRVALGVWLVTSEVWNLILTYRFTHGFWVA